LASQFRKLTTTPSVLSKSQQRRVEEKFSEVIVADVDGN
jgi:hypothetical protein